MVDTIKISSNPEKVTTPGRKKVYRIINQSNHHSEGDYIALYDEQVNDQKRLRMFHPVHTFISKFVTNFYAKDLHELIFEKVFFATKTLRFQTYSSMCRITSACFGGI